MSNLLAVPFKKAYQVNIKDAARNYLDAYSGSHPDEFKNDILEWQSLRRNFIGETVHTDRINPGLSYHAQLVSILAKLPTNIQLDIIYAPVFSPHTVPVTLPNLAFERAAVLFNIASLYSQLAACEDRSTKDGIKRALANYQFAAGTFSYIISSALPQLKFSPDDPVIPLDLTRGFIKGLEWLMLAQAQECSWQAAKLDNYKNGLIARVASRTASLYHLAWSTIREASPAVTHLLPSEWLPHMEAKENHFEAVAQFRKSLDDAEAHKYGDELARLGQAQAKAKKAYDIAKRGKIAGPVLQDIMSLLDTVQKTYKRAERDNDLIYHHEVPSLPNLAGIAQAELARSTVPSGLLNPSTMIGPRGPLFSRLMGWGAREAINIYNDRRKNLIEERVVDVAQGIKDQTEKTLQALNLPAALEALERPIGLPPSLLTKAEEVRLEDGPSRIEASLDDVERLAQRDQVILNEAMDILDSEASEDEAARKTSRLDRLPSHEANVELVQKEQRYRKIMEQAAESDEVVRQKWDDWENNIIELTWSREHLEASVPSSTISSTTQTTQLYARSLRELLDDINDLHDSVDDVVQRAKMTTEVDDIQDRVLLVSAGFEKLAEVQPAMFEDILDDELAKYDKFLKELGDLKQKQGTTLSDLERYNELFLQSRKEDPSVKEREHALQSLDLAYHKYREIIRNLEEGFKFYNDLAGILIQFKESCKAWSHQRKQEIHGLSRSIESMSLRDEEPQPKAKSPPPPSPARMSPTSTRKPPTGKSSLGLPAINSSDWEFEDVALPPGPTRAR